MGMSATQARYLSLTAQKSNLEYHAQQINQERTILSQQVSELYNNLLAMSVPTPPNTQEYTKVVYSGSLGATDYSFEPTNVKPGRTGSYIVTLEQEFAGDSIQKNTGYVVVGSQLATMGFDELSTDSTYQPSTSPTSTCMVQTNNPQSGTAYILENGAYRLATDDEINNPSLIFYEAQQVQQPPQSTNYVSEVRPSASLNGLWVLDASGEARRATIDDVGNATANGKYELNQNVTYLKDGNSVYYPIQDGSHYTIGGHIGYDINNAPITDEQKSIYTNAILNSGLMDSNREPYTIDDFYIYFNSNNDTNFVLKNDIDNNEGGYAYTYSYIANGNITQRTAKEDCLLTFDPTSGRIVEIAFPIYKRDRNGDVELDTDGNPVISSYEAMPVTATTITDENAYQDAYVQYQYAQYEYDRKQQEINAKTEVIQQQDRNLELKLQRLDTQRKAIDEETQALKKVLEDNIKNSFKTFG